MSPIPLFLLTLLFLQSNSQPFLGVNYGEVADNLPPATETAKLLQSTTISKLRLYGANPSILQSLAGTGISVVIGTSNTDVDAFVADPAAAGNWLSANVAPFHPATNVEAISVGNELLLYGEAPNLVAAMRNLRAAAVAKGMDGIKISTVQPMSVMAQSDPPSAGAFVPSHVETLKGVLQFLQETGSPFMINPYPFFAYRSDTRPETLAFCLFQPNEGRVDANTNIKYTNMFDAQVDAVRSAINALGFKDVEIVVAETGWPYNGDPNEAGASVENAKAYNGNLVAHLKSGVGTPLMPGKAIDTYIFALYDENLKPGSASEKAFGLYRPDLTMTYDIGLSKATQGSPTPSSNLTMASRKPATAWCVPKSGVSDEQLQANLDYACGQPNVDCQAIQPNGACYLPNTLLSHATYAMNMLYQSSGKHPANCDFRQTAKTTSQNPSYDVCVYPGS